jgi:hypothetical protein
LLQKAADTLGGQLANMASMEHEQADHDEVQDHLNRLLDHVATHVFQLRDGYRRASTTMPAVGLNPYDQPINFISYDTSTTR